MANKKKIFDITPPLKRTNNLLGASKIVKVKNKPIQKSKPKKPWPVRIVLIGAGALLIAVFCYLFIKPEAEIEIWPVKETKVFQTQFLATGELMTQTQLSSQDFAATGKAVKAEKAEGIVKIYNNYSLPQTLVQNTRLWCFEGNELREFKTTEKAVIPSQAQLDVKVSASLAGAEYNINPCTFSVPGLKGSPRYTAVYGKSALPMTGGIKTETTVISQEDLDKAEQVVIEKALADSVVSLKNSISPQDYVLLEDAVEVKMIEVQPLFVVGQTVDNFTFQATAQAQALVFKKAQAQDFAEDYVRSQLAQGEELVNNSLVLNYSLATVNLAKHEMVLDLGISAATYRALDESLIKENVKNIRLNDVASSLKKFPEIDRAQVRIRPFWRSIVPDDPSKIEIKLNLD